MRFPSTIRFPFGYDVKVRLVPPAEIAEQAEFEIEDAPDGLWLADRQTIFINRALPLRRQRYVLIHEMGHALWDFQHQMFGEKTAAI